MQCEKFGGNEPDYSLTFSWLSFHSTNMGFEIGFNEVCNVHKEFFCFFSELLKKSLQKSDVLSIWFEKQIEKQEHRNWLMGCAWILTHAPLLYNGFRAWE
jgi:hypothetical protein